MFDSHGSCRGAAGHPGIRRTWFSKANPESGPRPSARGILAGKEVIDMPSEKEAYQEPLLTKHERLVDVTGQKYGEKEDCAEKLCEIPP